MSTAIPRPRRTTTAVSATAPALAAAPPPVAGTATVVVVDPYPVARDGIAYLTRRYPDLRLVGAAGSEAEAHDVIDRTNPRVVLISDDLTDGGRAFAAGLRASHPRIGLVVLSHRTHDLLFPQVRDAGAAAFVSQSAPVTALVSAIRHAATSPRTFRTFGVPWAVEQDAAQVKSLSQREQQVLTLMGDGLSIPDIAATLQVGPGTVRTYISRLYSKLQVPNRARAVLAAATDPVSGPAAGPAPQPARTVAARPTAVPELVPA